MARLSLSVALLVALFSVLVLPRPGNESLAVACVSPLIFGDMDNNGQVQATEALWVLRQVVGLPNPEPCSPRDIDCDGDVDSADALKLLRYVAGLSYQQQEPCTDIGQPYA